MTTIVVITKVPEGDESGNLAMAGLDLKWATGERREDYTEDTMPLIEALTEMLGDGQRAAMFMLSLRESVFQLGEVMFLNGMDREILYPGRKPDKWSVEYEVVDTLDEALALSEKVTEEARVRHEEARRAAGK